MHHVHLRSTHAHFHVEAVAPVDAFGQGHPGGGYQRQRREQARDVELKPGLQYLVDTNIAQQGYATSEPYSIEKAGIKPKVFLLADLGYPPYAQTLVTTDKVLRERRDALTHFLRATAEGWKSYLANPAPGNALVRKANPEIEDALLAFSVDRMKSFGLVTGGEAGTQGILAMTDARWKQTYDFMLDAGLVRAGTDYRKAYTLDLLKGVKVLP